jgi:ketosteroid isomerase-like protein
MTLLHLGARAALVASLLLAAACGGPTERRPIYEGPDVDAIRAAEVGINAAIEQRDLDAVLRRYEPAGLITEYLRVDEHGIGPEGGYRQFLGDPNSALSYGYSHVEVARSGDMAVSDGECTITRTNPVTSHGETYIGACMKLWRRSETGDWLIAREMRGPVHNRD